MVKIVTLAFNRPDFIELQLNSIKKWVPEFEFTVFDNCPDDAIKNECERLGVKCIPIKIFSEDPSWAVGLSLDKMWATLQFETGILVYLDSDMFLINPLPDIDDYHMAYVPQVKKQYTYPWTGLMMFNMDTLPSPGELFWHVDYRLEGTDVGGFNHFYLHKYYPRVLELEMWTLVDENKCSFNGADSICEYNDNLIATLCGINGFPRPYSIDMFKVRGKPFTEAFVFHYKSASNYAPFATPEYNRLKTEALKKYLLWS
jgi:glycosyltransferase involved in cell wall biosynthesis